MLRGGHLTEHELWILWRIGGNTYRKDACFYQPDDMKPLVDTGLVVLNDSMYDLTNLGIEVFEFFRLHTNMGGNLPRTVVKAKVFHG